MANIVAVLLHGKIFKGDKVVWMVYFLLCVISLVEIYSASSRLTFGTTQSHWAPMLNQLIFLSSSFIFIVILHLIPSKWFFILAPILWPFFVILLGYTSLIGGSSLNATHRWISIFGISVQPSELVKGSLIMWTALILSRSQGIIKTEKGKIIMGAVKGNRPSTAFWWITGPLVLSCGLIFMDNISTATMLFIIIVLMMILGHIPWMYLFKMFGALLMVGGIMMSIAFVTPDSALESNGLTKRLVTMKHRFQRYTGNDSDKEIVFGSAEWRKKMLDDKNSQSTYSKIAIANSHVIGLGPGNSVQRDFLQHAESDFIYGIIVEELGIVGAFIVMGLYIILLVRCNRIAQKCRRFFPAYIVLGFGMMMTFQALVNMAVAVGAMPVTGQTLPFISRGGSSIVVTSFYIAVILSISRYADASDKEVLTVEPVTEGETKEFATEGNMA